jgi:hypothetical protein
MLSGMTLSSIDWAESDLNQKIHRRVANRTLPQILSLTVVHFLFSMLRKEPAMILDEALPFKVIRIRPHDEFRRRADECRRLAATARNASDRAFWLRLVERWQALESQSVRQAPSSVPSSANAGGKGRGALAAPKAVRAVHGKRF